MEKHEEFIFDLNIHDINELYRAVPPSHIVCIYPKGSGPSRVSNNCAAAYCIPAEILSIKLQNSAICPRLQLLISKF